MEGRGGKPIEVYIDGSRSNHIKAGIGIWWGKKDKRNFSAHSRQHFCDSNTTELEALIVFLERIGANNVSYPRPTEARHFIVNTDSTSAIVSATLLVPAYREHGWKKCKSSQKPLLRYLDILLSNGQSRKIQVTMKYVPGHSGNAGNKGADRLAKAGANLPKRARRRWDEEKRKLLKRIEASNRSEKAASASAKRKRQEEDEEEEESEDEESTSEDEDSSSEDEESEEEHDDNENKEVSEDVGSTDESDSDDDDDSESSEDGLAAQPSTNKHTMEDEESDDDEGSDSDESENEEDAQDSESDDESSSEEEDDDESSEEDAVVQPAAKKRKLNTRDAGLPVKTTLSQTRVARKARRVRANRKARRAALADSIKSD